VRRTRRAAAEAASGGTGGSTAAGAPGLTIIVSASKAALTRSEIDAAPGAAADINDIVRRNQAEGKGRGELRDQFSSHVWIDAWVCQPIAWPAKMELGTGGGAPPRMWSDIIAVA
jgi:hypothetical protein